VALVQVPGGRFDRQGAQGAHAPDAQHQLLVEAHLPAADVEDVRDGSIGTVVLGLVRVEEEDRYPADLGEEDGDRERPTRQLDVDVHRTAVAPDDALDRQP